MPIVDNKYLTSSPNATITSEQVYGPQEPDYSGESLWDTATRYSNAFWASAEENMITSKFALTAYQKGEEILEDIDMFLSGEKKDPNFNPFDHISGYEDYALEFNKCDTIGDVNRVKKRIDAENRNYSAMSKVPAGINFTNNLITGFLDPVNLIPVGGSIAKAQGFVSGAIRGAAMSGSINAATEYVLKEMSYNYTDEEYMQNVLIGTVFGGALGGVAGTVNKLAGSIDKAKYNQTIKENIDAVRKNSFDDNFQNKKGEFIDNFNKQPDSAILIEEADSTVGAAMVKAPATEVDLDNKLVKSIFWAERKWNPVARLSTSVSRKTREVAYKLFELPYFTKGTQDAFNVESLNKKANTELAFLNRYFMDNYKRYYFDKEDVGFVEEVKLLNPFSKPKEGKMTPTEFNDGIWDYIKKGENSDNKYIVDSANKFKAVSKAQGGRINRLYEQGLVDVKAVDDNWLPMVIDKDKVIANRVDFEEAVAQKMGKYADDLKKSGEVENKQKESENLETNIEKFDQENKELAPKIKELNRREYYLKNDVRTKEGQLHEAKVMLERELRSLSKKEARAQKIDKNVIGKTDREFLRQIKSGLPKDLRPKRMSEDLVSRGILVDDAEGLAGKDAKFTLQGYKGRKLDEMDVVSWDDLTEMYWQEGWYRERPYIDDIANDLIDDANNVRPKYHEKDYAYLERERSIDETRDLVGRLGYNYTSMTLDQIDSLLTEIGDKGYIKRTYVNDARLAELGKATSEQRASINKLKERVDYLEQELRKKKDELSVVSDDLQSSRRLRDINKEDMKKAKSKLKKYQKDLEWQETIVRLTKDDFVQYASEFTDDVLGVKNVGKSFDNIRIEDRGSLLSRDFLSGDVSVLEPFLVKDITKLLSPLRKEMIDLNLIEKFGSVGLDAERADIANNYRMKRRKYELLRKSEPQNAEKINKLIAQLDSDRDADLDFLTLSVDRMRGTEYAKRNYSKGVMKATEVAKLYNILTSLGKVLISSIPDISGVLMKSDIMSALPSLKALKNVFNRDLVKDLMKTPELAHAVSELFSNYRELSFAEMLNRNPFESNIMKNARGYVDVYMHLNLLPRWNALIKSVSGLAYMNKIYKLASKVDSGKPLTKAERNWANLYGFSDDELKGVLSNMNKHGNTSGPQKYANTVMWEDRVLADKFVLGINKIMDLSVVTPGAERARVFDDPILSLVFQFRQFPMSSVPRTLVPALQNYRDYNTAAALATSLFLGMASVAAKDALSGKTDRSAGDYIVEGFSSSGIAGWIEMPYSMMNAATRGGFDRAMYAATGGFMGQESMSPYESNRILLQQLGPSFGKIANLTGFIGDVSTGNISKSSMYKLKSLIPMQNTIYLDWVLKNLLVSWSEDE